MSEHLGAAGIHVVEVDEDAGAYSALGHIPGAIALDWRTDLQSSTSRDIVGAEEFAALLGARGIAPGDTVVLYGGNHNWFAAFGYWLFKLYSHADVRMLDGGRMKWTMEGRPLTDEVPEPVATDYPVPDIDAEIRALRSDVLDGLEDDVLIDVRSVDEFTGRLLAPPHLPQEGGQQRGHIPGALSIPWNRAVARDGTFRSDEDLPPLCETSARRGGRGPRRHLLPHRRTLLAHLVRAARAPRRIGGRELRRQLGGIRITHRRSCGTLIVS